MVTHPLISVLITACNHPNMLREAIASVLAQTYPEVEIVVVNDGGETVQSVIESFDRGDAITYIHRPFYSGRSAALNEAIRASHGEYIAYLDEKDIYYPEHLSTLMDEIRYSAVSVVYSDAYEATIQFEGDSYSITNRMLTHSSDFNQTYLVIENRFPNLAILHKRACLDEVGEFDETLASHEHWELWIRMSLRYEFVHVPEITAEYRVEEINPNSMIKNMENALESRILIYEKYRFVYDSSPILTELQGKIIEKHRKTLELSLASELTFVEQLVKLIERNDVEAGVAYYKAHRDSVTSSPDVERIDAIIAQFIQS